MGCANFSCTRFALDGHASEQQEAEQTVVVGVEY